MKYQNLDSFEFDWKQIQTNNTDSELKDKAYEIWVKWHEKWAEDFRNNNPEEKTREKNTTDKKWIEKNKTNTVDILNTAFEELPRDWQGENLDAWNAVISLIDAKIKLWHTLDIEKLSSEVHEDWMKRNPIEDWKNEEDKAKYVPYSQLSEELKELDRNYGKSAL